MTPSTPLKTGVIGILLFFFGAAVTCAQTFTFKFDSSSQERVFTDSSGSDPIKVWGTDDNPLDDADGTADKSGSVFFSFESGASLFELKFEAGNYLNWRGEGLGDGSNGLNEPEEVGDTNEFIRFTFDSDFVLDVVDLASFTSAGNDRLSVLRNGHVFRNYVGSDAKSGGVLEPSLRVFAGDEIELRNEQGNFYIQALTVSAIPEPSVLISAGLACGLVLLVRRKRQRLR